MRAHQASSSSGWRESGPGHARFPHQTPAPVPEERTSRLNALVALNRNARRRRSTRWRSRAGLATVAEVAASSAHRTSPRSRDRRPLQCHDVDDLYAHPARHASAIPCRCARDATQATLRAGDGARAEDSSVPGRRRSARACRRRAGAAPGRCGHEGRGRRRSRRRAFGGRGASRPSARGSRQAARPGAAGGPATSQAYSVRRATSGSTRDAFCAGKKQAATPTMAIKHDATGSVSGTSGDHAGTAATR